MEYTNTPFEQLMESDVQRGTIEESNTTASKASRNEEHAQKVFYFSCMQVTDMSFLHQKPIIAIISL